MITRYSRKKISSSWEEKNKFNMWLKIEKLACDAQTKLKVIPNDVAEKLSGAIKFDIERINEVESIVKHDVIAFLTYIAEKAGVDVRYLHYVMTSSDVLDTCLAVQLNLKYLLIVLKKT